MGLDYDVAGPSSNYLNHQPWYHGSITRVTSEQAVKANGEFLVRDSISQKGEYVLTARWKDKSIHFQINSQSEDNKRMYHFEEESFSSVVDLINCYISHKRPITYSSQCVISEPALKQDTDCAAGELEASYMRVLRPNLYSSHTGRTLQQQVCINQASRSEKNRPMSSISQHNLFFASNDKIPPPPPMLFHRPLPIPMKSREPSDDSQDYCDMDYDSMEPVLDASENPRPSFCMQKQNKKYSSSCHNLQRCISPHSSKKQIEVPKEKPSLPPRPAIALKKPVKKTVQDVNEEDYNDVSGRLIGEVEKEKRLSDGSTESCTDYDVLGRNTLRDSRDSGIYGSPSPPHDNHPNFSVVMLIKMKSTLQTVPAATLAAFVTKEDAAILRMLPENNTSLSGLKTVLLPCGSLLRSTLIERSRILVLSIVLTISSGKDNSCAKVWISVAHNLLRLGNIFGFVNVMDALTCNMVKNIRRVWEEIGLQSSSEFEELKSIYYLVQNHGTIPHCTVTIPFVQPILEIMSSGDSQFLDHNTYSIELNSLFQWLDEARDWSSRAEKLAENIQFKLSSRDSNCPTLSTFYLKKLLCDNTVLSLQPDHYNSIVDRIQKLVLDN